ncbi:DUF4287 domain-containing protein [Caulobacter sp. KR2-114]|uniref:DUF4287 domain-containing protein n=1 Tax=Caulobacter sp. KR2-114 TaxID=3400912 RepID=UPI003BFF0E66
MADRPLTQEQTPTEDQGRTEQQRKWRASVRASLETTTGRSLAQWVEIAGQCPETRPRARQKWFKDVHGLGQNYAMLVMGEAARAAGVPRSTPEQTAAALWTDANAAAIARALQAKVDAIDGAITGQRKTYATWSRRYAFAAARPGRPASTVRLGLALEPDADPRLSPPGREGWSERLKSTLVLVSATEVDAAVATLLRQAFAAS